MLTALVVLVTIGAFILGITISAAKGYVEDYIENAAYAKSVIIQKCWTRMVTLYMMNYLTFVQNSLGLNGMKMKTNY